MSLPLSGTGRYAVELIRSVGALRNNIVGIKGRQSYTGDQLIRVLEEMEPPQVDSLSLNGFTLNNGALRLRKILRNIPYSRQAYDAYNQRALARKSQFWLAKGGRHHDLNYALDPRAGHLSTVYDLSNIVCPETHPRSRVKHLNEYFGRLSRSNSPIITISNTVKLELVTHYGINDSRIHVTPLAASEVYHPRSPEACQQTLQQYSLDYKKYVLCVATLEPRKNLLRVLDAYESLDPQTRAEFPLVMVGASGWKSSALSKRIHRLQKVGSIRHLGFLPQHDLPVLYASASVFVYPSLYEGFGLPLLEAMQSGCACITSDVGALAEVSSENALQVDPHQSEEIASAMKRLLGNSKLSAAYGRLGVQRAADFSWRKTAHETCRIYSRL